MTDKEKFYKLLNNIVDTHPHIDIGWNGSKHIVNGLSDSHGSEGYHVNISQFYVYPPEEKYRIYVNKSGMVFARTIGVENINSVIRAFRNSEHFSHLVEGIE